MGRAEQLVKRLMKNDHLIRALVPEVSAVLWPLLLVFPVMGLKVVDGSLRYSLHRTTLETLFVPLTRELRDRVKTFIDVIGQRGGQAIASLLIIGATMLPGWQMVIASLLLALGWAWIRTAVEIE